MIDAVLFAHIHNDSSLTGTYGLQGMGVDKAIEYLKYYALKAKVPPAYQKLISNLDYLAKVSRALYPRSINTLAQSIATKVEKLPVGQTLLLPGGWSSGSGHVMIYQFTRLEKGWRFTINNSGDGLQYHNKLSTADAELYNPIRSWTFPLPKKEGSKQGKELTLFIVRLLRANIAINSKGQAINVQSTKIYQKILLYLAFLKATEEENKDTPLWHYTRSQLSGTCAERVIHQYFKVNSASLHDYQCFIFEYKQFSLNEYTDACLTGKQPFTAAVAEQIILAIDNNLKLLNTPLFPDEVTANYFADLSALKIRVQQAASTIDPPKTLQISSQAPRYSLRKKVVLAQPPANHLESTSFVPISIAFHHGKNLLATMAEAINRIRALGDPAVKYMYVEQLLLALPLSAKGSSLEEDFYHELTTREDFVKFKKQLNTLHCVLKNLHENWFNKVVTPSYKYVVLSALSLYSDVHDYISCIDKQPLFTPFVTDIIAAILDDPRNPFWGTSQPALDKRKALLHERYYPTRQNKDKYLDYLKALLRTNPELNNRLTRSFKRKFDVPNSGFYETLRSKGLESLYMIYRHFQQKTLKQCYNPLIEVISNHLLYEAEIVTIFNPFIKYNISDAPILRVIYERSDVEVITLLNPNNSYVFTLASAIEDQRYPITNFQITCSLTQHNRQTANDIQLYHLPTSKDAIIARDYFHLRSNPDLQVQLTIDYFRNNIAALAQRDNQYYLKANLLESGLLLKAMDDKSLPASFDALLAEGMRYFASEGYWTKESLFLLDVNFLVSRYWALADDKRNLQRLKTIHRQITNDLPLVRDPVIQYVLQHYLFLTLAFCLEHEGIDEALLLTAFLALVYINSHPIPALLENTIAHFETEMVMACFKELINTLTSEQQSNLIQRFISTYSSKKLLLSSQSKHPLYYLCDANGDVVYYVDILQAKVFTNVFTSPGNLPLQIKTHDLIKHLNVNNSGRCLLSLNGQHIQLPEESMELFYKDNNLTVRKNWSIDGVDELFELQALTNLHLAKHANKNLLAINPLLPKVLLDGSVDYWKSTVSNRGMLVRNNRPAYLEEQRDAIIVLDEKGFKTCYHLAALPQKWHNLLSGFEGSDFIIAHHSDRHISIELPCFGLVFTLDTTLPNASLLNRDTEEQVIPCPSPIHPNVAGLVLAKEEERRYIVPVVRFYATRANAQVSDFYPIIHDTQGVIANSALNKHWKGLSPSDRPLWHYQQSKRFISFRLQQGEPVADTVVDALYLAYLYLATHQTEKAWKILDHCNTSLGGLTGDVAELQFIMWINKELPHRLPDDTFKVSRKSPVYVACKLKALSMLCDYLLRDRKFNLAEPSRDNTANFDYAKCQAIDLKKFRGSLQGIISKTLNRWQSLQRHLNSFYRLSTTERKRLLDFCFLNYAPTGALGYQWQKLTLLAMQQEYAYLKRKEHAEEDRIRMIEDNWARFPNIAASRSIMQRAGIRVYPPEKITISDLLKKSTKAIAKQWQAAMPAVPFNKSIAALLLSGISEDDLVHYFPYFVQMATSTNVKVRNKVLKFCTRVILAKRSRILPLCRVLYYLIYYSQQEGAKQVIGLDFDTLQNELSTVAGTVPPIYTVERECDHGTMAVNAQDIRTENLPLLSGKELMQTALPNDCLLKSLGFNTQFTHHLTAPQREKIMQLLADYQHLQQQNEQYLTEQLTLFANQLAIPFAVEQQAGKQCRDTENQQRQLAAQLLQHDSLVKAMLLASEAVINAVNGECETYWAQAITLANQGPDDPKRALSLKIARASQARSTLTRADLLVIYRNADQAYALQQTELSPEKVDTLYDLIHQALVLGIKVEIANKIYALLGKAQAQHDVNTAAEALDLLARDGIPAINDRQITLLQHEEKIILHPYQLHALHTFITTTGSVLKIRMGGGKSSAIAPVLMEKMALGHNLVIMEVQRALLHTMYANLCATSFHVYGKKPYLFEFNRDSDCTVSRLKKIYEELIEVMVERSYIITAGECSQSLKLKLTEMLLFPKNTKEWENQVYWLEKIIFLFEKGECLIDEIQLGLWIKSVLNYACGSTNTLPVNLINNAIALFRCIDSDFIKDAAFLTDEFDWSEFKQILANKMLKEPSSPLYKFTGKACQKYGEHIEKELLAYLTGVSDRPCEAILKATPDDYETLDFFRQQISLLLPKTLMRRLNKNYGASQRKRLSAIEYSLAIPYAANNEPRENSRFGNVLETVNFTIMMMLLKGISQELLIEQLSRWKHAAQQQLMHNKVFKNIDDTPVGQGFALLMRESKLKLSQVASDNNKQLKGIHTQLQYNRSLIFTLLSEQVLKQIPIEGFVIFSDPFAHASLFGSVRGMSGTPYNYLTYHQRLHYQPVLGIDGYLLAVLDEQQAPVICVDYQQPQQFIADLFTHAKSPERVRALIDIRATFQGIPNFQVAQQLASYIANHSASFKTIKHVLYFNDEQRLCALAINNPDKPIVLGKSDTSHINSILRSTPAERFTYYDQTHTLGADIKQDPHASALVLVDEESSTQALQDFLQGAARMRELHLHHTVELIVPKSLQGISRTALIERMAQHAENMLKLDISDSAPAKMANIARMLGDELIGAITPHSPREKSLIALLFIDYFARTNQQQECFNTLADYRQHILDSLDNILEKIEKGAGLLIIAEQHMRKRMPFVKQELTKIVNQYSNRFKASLETDLVVEVELQKQAETEIQTQTLNEYQRATRIPEGRVLWDDISLEGFYANEEYTDEFVLPLNKVCKRDEAITLFSPQLWASQDYARTYFGQKNLLDLFLKPALLVWYHRENNTLHAMIATPQEARRLISLFPPNSSDWLETTEGSVVAGKRASEDQDYLLLREQLWFFAGNFKDLSTQKSLPWLEQQTTEKLAFYEKNILPSRPQSANEFRFMKETIATCDTEGLAYITRHVFDNLVAVNWQELIPLLSAMQAAEYTRLAQALHYVNTGWFDNNFTGAALQEKFGLSLNSLDCLTAHLDHVNKLKTALNHLPDDLSSPFLWQLSSEDKAFFTDHFGTSFTQLYQGLKQPELSSKLSEEDLALWQLASFDFLLLLKKHPAFYPSESYINHAESNIERCISAILDNLDEYVMPAPIALRFLRLMEEQQKEVFNRNLPLEEMINVAQAHDLTRLLKLKQHLSARQLGALAAKVTNTEDINLLLKHAEMTPEIALSLAIKPACDADIKQWQWLNEEQLVYLLKNVTDYKRLKQVLHHDNLSQQAILNWLAELQQQQRVLESRSASPRQQLDASLHALKVKAATHACHSLQAPRYDAAAETSFTLYQSLNQETTAYFTAPSANKHRLTTCRKAMAEARPVLEQHRGYKQNLWDIMNFFIALFINNQRFFKAKTESSQLVTTIDRLLPTAAS